MANILIKQDPIGHFSIGKVEFDFGKRVSVFVGQNNIGKSRLIEALGKAFSTDAAARLVTENGYLVSLSVDDAFIKYVQQFRSNNQLSEKHYQRLVTAHKTLTTREIQFSLKRSEYGNVEASFADSNEDCRVLTDFVKDQLALHKWGSPVKIAAERDIRPAPSDYSAYSPNGDSITFMTYFCLNDSKGDTKIIDVEMLKGLNSILAPNFHFTRIRCQDQGSGLWAISLESKTTPKLTLDALGSGIKTIFQAIMIVKGYLHVYLHSHIAGQNPPTQPSHYVFEEIENNLHPRVIKRLIDYLIDNINPSETRIVFSTHSPVVIDHLSSKHDAAIHHVYQSDNEVVCHVVQDYRALGAVIDDLGAKPSDLLQANFIVWVEGPTEMIVVPHWISKIAPELNLGSDYVIAIYGGRLLARFSANEPDDREVTKVDVARLNRNFAFAMDSDGIVDGKAPTPGKQAILTAHESGEIEFPLWLTDGREIEDYYPIQSFSKVFGEPKNLEKLAERDPSWGFKKTVDVGWGLENQDSKKIDLANALVNSNLELEKRVIDGLTPIIDAIRKANA
jgi:putative ATP-dependent endonuclease of the OLD family